ncbi:MAG: hypothetical protein HW415_276 [Deltaproteobacteria bacterium]|nr:hypothetical protein [Deltaproteobacteria bacterium]
MTLQRSVISDLLRGIVLTLSFFLAGVTVPVLGLAVGLITPLPIAYYFRKIGMRYGFLLLLTVVTIVGFTAGIRVGAFFLAEFAAMGIALSESVRMKLPLGKGVLLSTAASIAGSALFLLSISSSLDKPLHQVIGDQVRENLQVTVDAYKKVGLPDEQVERLTEFTGRVEAIILKVFPSLFFIGTLSVAILNILALKGLLKKKGIEEYQVEPVTWRSPEPLVWLLIAGGVLLLLKNEWAWVIGLNLLVVCGGIYLFQGMAIMAFYFKKRQTPLFFKALGYLLIVFQQIFTIMVIGFGLFDLWFDFRRLKTEKPSKKEA